MKKQKVIKENLDLGTFVNIEEDEIKQQDILENMWYDNLPDIKDDDDKLNKIFLHQMELQKKLGVYEKISKCESMKQQYINQMILALHEEAVEIMRETAYKNPEYMPFGWKKGQEFKEEKFKEEIIDIIHFVMNLCIISGMNPEEIYNRYLNKNKENFKRQDENY